MLTCYALTCDYFTNPIGIDTPHPHLSWKLDAPQRDARQTAYQIQVTSGQDRLLWDGGIWDSDKQLSDVSLHVPYAGEPLQLGQRCVWQVRVWDENDSPSEWSDAAFWEMGLLDHSNWQAQWITPDWEEDTSQPQPAPLLRRAFATSGEIVAARIYATALGLYELHLNRQRVGDALLTPGWTSYRHRIQYQSYDVTALVDNGENALGVLLGDGWYRGHLGFQAERNFYGDRLALLLQLHITYADGRRKIVSSNGQDGQWRFFAYSSDLLAKMARVLGKSSDADQYAALAPQIKAAFTNEFVTSGGRVGPNSQTAYVLALHFDLLPEAMRAPVGWIAIAACVNYWPMKEPTSCSHRN